MWHANFRDLSGTLTRLGTLAPGGRIAAPEVEAEIRHLRHRWREQEPASEGSLVERTLGSRAATLDRFDRVQLEDVLEVCSTSPTLSSAGRKLFAHSRERKKSVNDSDRLRKYLRKFDLSWESLQREL